jgi:hypothetical protein
LGIIWDRPNAIRGSFPTIAGVFVETDCGIPIAIPKTRLQKAIREQIK